MRGGSFDNGTKISNPDGVAGVMTEGRERQQMAKWLLLWVVLLLLVLMPPLIAVVLFRSM